MDSDKEKIKLLPPMLAEIARRTSLDVALKIAAVWGGTTRKFPVTDAPHTELAQMVGVDHARVLASEYGGIRVYIPKGGGFGSMKPKIMDEKGSIREVALKIGCSERYVCRVRAFCK